MARRDARPSASGARGPLRREREITTPEGVVLRLNLADRGERAAAMIIDLLIMLAVIVVMILVLIQSLAALNPSVALSLGLIGFFLVRNCYFSFFELRWHGQTPGKRALGLRVVDRRGGQLRSDAVFARNLMREIELFLPVSLVLSQGDTALDAGAQLLAWIWVGIFVLMPFLNKDSLRVGDLIAGTWVIVVPKGLLLDDLVAERDASGSGSDATPVFTFTERQLDVYGVLELQTLEDILRRDDKAASEVIAEVAARIRHKIDYRDRAAWTDQKAFLDAYYAALRARLEARMLLGRHKRSKHD